MYLFASDCKNQQVCWFDSFHVSCTTESNFWYLAFYWFFFLFKFSCMRYSLIVSILCIVNGGWHITSHHLPPFPSCQKIWQEGKLILGPKNKTHLTSIDQTLLSDTNWLLIPASVRFIEVWFEFNLLHYLKFVFLDCGFKTPDTFPLCVVSQKLHEPPQSASYINIGKQQPVIHGAFFWIMYSSLKCHWLVIVYLGSGSLSVVWKRHFFSNFNGCFFSTIREFIASVIFFEQLCEHCASVVGFFYFYFTWSLSLERPVFTAYFISCVEFVLDAHFCAGLTPGFVPVFS